MKSKLIIIVVFIVLSGISSLGAMQQMRIVLKDHSVLCGELLELKDGFYRVKTSALGEIKIPADSIALISALEEDQQKSSAISVPEIREGALNAPSAVQHQNPRRANRSGAVSEGKNSSSQRSSSGFSEQQNAVNTQVQSMMMDGNFLQKVIELGESNNMQNVMQDQEIMEAIQNGDYEFLINNEKMKELINSPEMQSILGGMAE